MANPPKSSVEMGKKNIYLFIYVKMLPSLKIIFLGGVIAILSQIIKVTENEILKKYQSNIFENKISKDVSTTSKTEFVIF